MPDPLTYASVCSGIEAASVAWHPLGWTPAWFAEIEPFPCSVLAHRFPAVPNVGDFTAITDDYLHGIDLLVGGTPCQDFSVAGKRAGFDGQRGSLTFAFVELARRMRPRFIIWENVVGVLNAPGGGGFGGFLGAMEKLGYGWAYRVLDARYFGVAQRRRRVFVVFHLGGSPRRAAEVLFERGGSGNALGRPHQASEVVANCLEAQGFTRSRSSNGFTYIGESDGIRMMTPREAERLMGFPDDWTLVPHRGKPAADGPRYKALGNSFAVNVVRWIGRRIKMVEELNCGK